MHIIANSLDIAIKVQGFLQPNHPLARDSSLRLVSPTYHDTDTWLNSVAGTIAELETSVEGDPEKGLIGLRTEVDKGDASKEGLLSRNLTTINNLHRNDVRIRNANREAGSVIATSGYRTVELDGWPWCMG